MSRNELWTLPALVLLVIGVSLRVDADPDLWGHLKFGLDGIEHGLLRADPYSYTAHGRPWVNHEWLAEYSYAAAFSLLGNVGLIAIRIVLLAITVIALWRIARRRNTAVGVDLLVLVGVVQVLLTWHFMIWPRAYSVAMMAILLLVCDIAHSGRRQILWLMPILTCLWANFHGGFVAGLGIFGVHWLALAAGSWTTANRWRSLGFLIAIMIAAILATAVNPYGFQYWDFLTHAVSMHRPGFNEWSSVFIPNNRRDLVCFVLLVATPILLACLRFSKDRQAAIREWSTPAALADWAVFAIGVYEAAKHARHVALLTVLSAVLCFRLAARRPSSTPSTEAAVGMASRLIPLTALTLAFLIGGVGLLRNAPLVQKEGAVFVPRSFYPVDAVAFIIENKLEGNIDALYNWGEYCIFKLYPRGHVFCDGRFETVYPEEVWRLNFSEPPITGPDHWRRRVNDYPTELILTYVGDPFADWAATSGGFVEIYRDKLARLLARPSAKTQPFIDRPTIIPPKVFDARPPNVSFPG